MRLMRSNHLVSTLCCIADDAPDLALAWHRGIRPHRSVRAPQSPESQLARVLPNAIWVEARVNGSRPCTFSSIQPPARVLDRAVADELKMKG
jgi:hypothetical protein